MKTQLNPSIPLAAAGWLVFAASAVAGIASYFNQTNWLAAAGGSNALTVFSFQGPGELNGTYANDPSIVPSYASQGVVFLPFTGTSVFPVILRGQQFQISAPNHDGLLANSSSPNPTSDLEGRAIKFDFNRCAKSVGVNFNGPRSGGDYGHLDVFDANGNLIGQTADCAAGGFVGLVSDTPITEVHVVNTGNADITFGIWDLQFVSTPPKLIQPACVGTNFSFSFQTVSNLNYTVEYNDDLRTTNWLFLETMIANASLTQCCVPLTNHAQRFFRVRQP